MPKNKVSDPITDQEMAFARLVLSGATTDRHAAEAVGLNPDSAAYTKAKPRVRAYMLEHRAAVQQQLVQQEADLSRLSRPAVERAVDGLHRLNLDRQQVLARLWQIANLSPEITRGSVTGQVKALSMIIAMQNFIPARPGLPWDRRAVSTENNPAPAPVNAQIYQAEWLRKQQATTTDSQPTPPVPARRGAPQEEASACPGVPWSEPGPAPGPVAEPALPAPACRGSEVEWAPLDPAPSQPTFAHRVPLADGLPPYVPHFNSAPDTRVPFSIKVNPFKHRR
jgi:hypothetical protein